MTNNKILNVLIERPNMIAYIEKVKETYLKQCNMKLNLDDIKEYMEKYVEKLGANWFYKKMILNAIDCYYDENGELINFKKGE